MNDQPWMMGGASEALQARIKAEKAARAELDPTPPAPEPAATPETDPDPDPELSPEINEQLAERSKYEMLEVLPDEDLRQLAMRHGLKVDGRWGRSRLLEVLIAAGITQPD